MKKIVIIGASEFQNPLILKAKEMGYETHVFAYKTGDIGESTADYFYPISIVDKEKILEECQKITPCGVVSIASDLAMLTVNYIADKLGLVGNSLDCTENTTNKFKMRQKLQNGGVYTPRFCLVNKDNFEIVKKELFLPVVVKPIDRSGSRGINKIMKWQDLEYAINEALAVSFGEEVIVEEYIEGEEYSCECISFKGEHQFITITKKYTTGFPNFIETGHVQPATLFGIDEEKIKLEILRVLDVLEIKNGASHSEFKITNNGEVRIIEVGARMGGDCIGSDLVELSTGYDFVKGVIQVAVGEKPIVIKSESRISCINFIFSEEDYEKMINIKKHHENYFVRENIEKTFENKITDSSNRYGFYIMKI